MLVYLFNVLDVFAIVGIRSVEKKECETIVIWTTTKFGLFQTRPSAVDPVEG